MAGHYSALVNMKSSGYGAKPPRQHIKKIAAKNQKPKKYDFLSELVKAEQFEEARELFKRVGRVREGGTDCW